MLECLVLNNDIHHTYSMFCTIHAFVGVAQYWRRVSMHGKSITLSYTVTKVYQEPIMTLTRKHTLTLSGQHHYGLLSVLIIKSDT